jgi:hypothetical protein
VLGDGWFRGWPLIRNLSTRWIATKALLNLIHFCTRYNSLFEDT